MRQLNDPRVLFAQIENQTRSVELSEPGENLTRKLVSDIPEWSSRGFDFEMRIKGNLKLKEKIALSIFQWFTTERSLAAFISLYLEERGMIGLSDSDKFLLGLCLNSKGQTKLFLLETQLWSMSSFFGGIYSEERLCNLLRRIKFSISRMPKPKYTERHRGYRDKGSRRLAHEIHSDYKNDWSSVQLQMELERRRDVLRDTLQFAMSDTFAR